MNKKRIVIFLLVVGFVFLFWSSSLLQEYFQEGTIFLENYGQIHPLLSVLVFIGLSALSAMLMSFSSIWLVPAAVVLWDNHLTVIMLLISWLIGATASYFIGKYGGYSIVHKLVSEKKISYYQHLITDKLSFWVIFLFRLTLPSEIPGYLLGIARYPFWRYLLITFLAEAPYAIYAVYAIDSVVEKDRTMFAITAFIWFVVVWVLTYLYMKKVKKNSSV
jgi:uncharacterized membrane protein YdjX (TVP38/TMEM64 family)